LAKICAYDSTGFNIASKLQVTFLKEVAEI